MPKVVLGKTPEQLRAEEAERQREIESQIQQSQLERQAKIEALHKKQKNTKIAVIACISGISAILIVFGTYNTFFKKTITVEDVKPEINAAINYLAFPSEGLDNYIRDNCETLFNKYMTYDLKNSNIKSIEVDKNSCNISRVKKLNSVLSQVYFSVDVVVSENDSEVTDPEVIKKLVNSGLLNNNSNQTTSTTNNSDSTTETTTGPEDNTLDYSDTTDYPEDTSEFNTETTTVDDSSNLDSMPVAETTVPEATPADVEATPSGIANAEDGYESEEEEENEISAKEEEKTYYINSSGKIMQSGAVTRVRYNFYIPIEFYYVYSDVTEDGTPTGSVVGGGFRPAGDMTLYTLEQPDVNTFDEISYYSAFTCDETTIVDEETLRQMQVKVDKVLDDLYSGRDTSQDFYNYRKFNGFNSAYTGIVNMTSYNQTNALGMNTHVTYSIKTSQGFIYTLESWMLVEKDGNSWIIKDML